MSDYWYTDVYGRKRHVTDDSYSDFTGESNIFTSKYNRDRLNAYQDITVRTSCPICNDDVYFIRHNGGSIYVDDLGWPWPKHKCFEKSETTKWYHSFHQESNTKDEALPGVVQEIESDRDILTLTIDFGNIGKAKVKIEKTVLEDSIKGLLSLVNFKNRVIVFSTDFGAKRIISLEFQFQDQKQKRDYPYIINF